MKKTPRNLVSDVLGASRLAVAGTVGVAALVESMHHTISQVPLPWGDALQGGASGIAGLVYKSVRGVAQVVGMGLEEILETIAPLLGEQGSSLQREILLAVLNGVVGDYLEETKNSLTLSMNFRKEGRPLVLKAEALAEAYPQKSGKLLVLVHGLCMSELQWTRNDHNHGFALAEDLGFQPLFVHYNTGLHISTNGERLSLLLEELVSQWPVEIEELAILGYSMGGLVTRSAHDAALRLGHIWPQHLKRWVFLGTPHHGSPLERGGNHIDWFLDLSPYAAPFSRLGKVRSAGITDLRHGNLVHEDWDGLDRFSTSHDARRPVPLPEGVESFAIAGTLAKEEENMASRHLGDGLVPVESALGKHASSSLSLAFPAEHQWVGCGMNHLDLLDRMDVYEQLRAWLRNGEEKST